MKEGMTKLELKRQRIKELKLQTQQRKQLIEISPKTLLLFKNVSSLMGDNFMTYDQILSKVLDHWLQCPEIEIDRY